MAAGRPLACNSQHGRAIERRKEMKSQAYKQLFEQRIRDMRRMVKCNLRWILRSASAVLLVVSPLVQSGEAQNVVTEWNQNAMQAIRTGNTHFTLHARVLAMLHASIFDAINGIDRRYSPVHVGWAAAPGASRRAAAIQAAYTVLVAMYPSQKAILDQELVHSLASITDDGDYQSSQSIARGRAWGEEVAQDILAWRSTDGLSDFVPFFGGTNPGQWRSLNSPPTSMPNPQLSAMVPFAMTSPAQFRTTGPPALTSAQYAADVQEVQLIGKSNSLIRTPEQTAIALFWTDPAVLHWNRIALTTLGDQELNLLETARLFADLNIAMADGMIANWDGKIAYNFWRPTTAIRLADTDGNPLTIADPTWAPLLSPPNFPEYSSNHAVISTAAAVVLAALLGDNHMFTHVSFSLGTSPRTHISFSTAAAEAVESRIYGGIHFRTGCTDGILQGFNIGQYVLTTVAQPDDRGPASQSHNHGAVTIRPDGELYVGAADTP